MSAHCKGPVILIWAAVGEILKRAAQGSLQGKSSDAHFSDRRQRTLRSTSPHCRRSDLPRGGTSHLSDSRVLAKLQHDLDSAPPFSCSGVCPMERDSAPLAQRCAQCIASAV